MSRLLLFASLSLLLVSCSSVKSIREPVNAESDGLTYFMPKRDFLVTINVEGGALKSVALGTTAAYADLSKQYVLRHGSNAFGKNTLDVGVSATGLLTSAKSTTVSGALDAFKNLAASAGSIQPMLAPVLGVNTCTRDGDHVFRYETAGPHAPCGITVNISRAVAPGVKGHNKAADKAHSGVFYRQNEPYVMTATGQGFNEAAVVYSPSNAETLFLPVAKTFFANNEADFSFRDGVPTKYKQETEGEAVALLKLPAEVIAAYFKAVGGVFDSFKSNDQKEAAALNASVALELARQKYAACIDAIEQGDEDLIKSLECKD